MFHSELQKQKPLAGTYSSEDSVSSVR
ncbi:hypothetical protein CCACVL1_01923 [Corchorus capsularis]|uniref:Uncharacterized protein n=1 Tax=Corchorus capsularis TaxID=210143 RepID=A0A1R3KE77_COCAP|nr:hypothetical protein CCACVL1_01923 [Corchorus capsularis]